MSNQVYANQQHKYFAQPGATSWPLVGSSFLVGTTPDSVPFAPIPTYNQGNASSTVGSETSYGGLRYDAATDEFISETEGLYYLGLAFVATNSPAPVAGDRVEVELAVQLLTGNGAATNEDINLWLGGIVVPTSPLLVSMVSNATVFLPQGAHFRVLAQALSTTAVEIIGGAGNTRLLVTKIA